VIIYSTLIAILATTITFFYSIVGVAAFNSKIKYETKIIEEKFNKKYIEFDNDQKKGFSYLTRTLVANSNLFRGLLLSQNNLHSTTSISNALHSIYSIALAYKSTHNKNRELLKAGIELMDEYISLEFAYIFNDKVSRKSLQVFISQAELIKGYYKDKEIREKLDLFLMKIKSE